MLSCSEQEGATPDRILPPWLDAAGAATPSGGEASPAPHTPPAARFVLDAPVPGRWVKGQSGNPRGRPVGRPDARTKITRALMDEGLEIARVVTEAAKEGDLQACGIVLARIAPVLRPEAQPVQFDFDPAASPARQVEMVLAAVAGGALPVDLGKQLIDSVKALADVRAFEELEKRVVMLEARPA